MVRSIAISDLTAGQPLFNADLPRIAEIVRRAGLTEHDIDLATSGLCGTFALALYRHLTNQGIPARLAFVCLRRKDGSPDYVPGHDGDIRHIRWRHALVESGGAYFDIEGRIELAHAFHNYCWQGAATASLCQSASVSLRRSFVRPGRPTTAATTSSGSAPWPHVTATAASPQWRLTDDVEALLHSAQSPGPRWSLAERVRPIRIEEMTVAALLSNSCEWSWTLSLEASTGSPSKGSQGPNAHRTERVPAFIGLAPVRTALLT
jgi:hypothetical protein